MPRYKLTIAYDGTNFCGWQKQEPYANNEDATGEAAQPLVHRPLDPTNTVGRVRRDGEDRDRLKVRTVQEVVEQAVRAIVREPVNLHGASRTDSGVHAKGQVGAFTCSGDEPENGEPSSRSSGIGWPLSRGTDRLLRALNGRLPEDVMITAVEPIHQTFNPTTDADRKTYSYTFHTGHDRPLFDRHFVHHCWETLDSERMHRAAQHLVGEHDFVSFAAANHGRLTTVRTIFSCNVLRIPAPSADPLATERIRIEVCGSGFLYNMVRIIAGTLLEVGRGRMPESVIPTIIAGKDRRAAGPTLPPTGLCLEWIKYRQPN